MPDQFVLDCIEWREGEGPTKYQLEILRSLVDHDRVCVRGPHGLGKSSLCAWTLLWFALTRDGNKHEDWKVVTTASVWRQLENFLWPEIHKWAKRLRWQMIGRPEFSSRTEFFDLSLKLENGEAMAAATNDPQQMEGAHASHILYIFDESKIIPEGIWDSVEGALSSEGATAIDIVEAKWLAVSTPGESSGQFYNIQKRRPGTEDWWTRAVKLGEVIAAGRIGATWADNRRRNWGAKSARYINKVQGDFADASSDAIIPLSWIEAANERWHNWKALHDYSEQPSKVGIDVARYGADLTVMAPRYTNAIDALYKYGKEDTMETAGRALIFLRAHPGCVAVIDTIGVGAGVFDRVREQVPDRVESFNAALKTDWTDLSGELKFADTRSAAWWYLRELLDPSNGHEFCLPPDDDSDADYLGDDEEPSTLTGDLTTPTWRTLSNGAIKLESKEDIYRRIHRSTNCGDAVVMAVWGGEIEEGAEFA